MAQSQPADARSLLEDVRQSIREKHGFNDSSSAPTHSILTPVKHRVQAIEHSPSNSVSSPTVPESQALSHSTSATWRQLRLDTGRSAWQHERKEGDECFTADKLDISSNLDNILQPDQPLLELPEVSTVQQAQEIIQKLQHQAYLETRRLHGAKVLARQAAEQLYACQQEAEHDNPPWTPPSDTRLVKAQTTAEAKCRHRLTMVQSHMFELSKDVSLVELALELAEARYNIMCAASGDQATSPSSLLASQYSARPSMQKLFKQLSLASSDQGRTEQTDTCNVEPQASNSTPTAQALDMQTTAQQNAVQQHAAESSASCGDSAASPGSVAASSFSCHTSGSASAPATPALAYRLEQSDSTSDSDQAATARQPSAEHSPVAADAVPSDSIGSIVEIDVGLDEAIQACSDLIFEIKDEMDRKGQQQPVRIASSWTSAFALSVASLLAVCSGTAATWGNMGYHISAINWYPT